jgi:hypothetical protein
LPASFIFGIFIPAVLFAQSPRRQKIIFETPETCHADRLLSRAGWWTKKHAYFSVGTPSFRGGATVLCSKRLGPNHLEV